MREAEPDATGLCLGQRTDTSSHVSMIGPQPKSLIKLINTHQFRGAIAQLGERIVRNDEVVGSIPTSSTIVSITWGIASSALFTCVSFLVS